MLLDLSQITLCAADCTTPHLAARALELSMKQCCFGDALLFTDATISGSFKTISIKRLRSKNDYSQFIIKSLAQYIKTPFVLVVQWDGYVVDPSAWNPTFLDYDYCGAVWPHHTDGKNVGNGGFSLRSTKLLRATHSADFKFIENFPEDDLICRVNHERLVQNYGIRFAPESLAQQFSYEWGAPAGPTFGFHSLSNFWRHVDDTEMIGLADHLDSATIRSTTYMFLMLTYFAQKKFTLWRALYGKLRNLAASDEITQIMARVIQRPELAPTNVQTWEKTWADLAG